MRVVKRSSLQVLSVCVQCGTACPTKLHTHRTLLVEDASKDHRPHRHRATRRHIRRQSAIGISFLTKWAFAQSAFRAHGAPPPRPAPAPRRDREAGPRGRKRGILVEAAVRRSRFACGSSSGRLALYRVGPLLLLNYVYFFIYFTHSTVRVTSPSTIRGVCEYRSVGVVPCISCPALAPLPPPDAPPHAAPLRRHERPHL